MNLQQLYKHIAKLEGKKSEVSIGDIREIVGIIADIFFDEDITKPTYTRLWKLGQRRAKRSKVAVRAAHLRSMRGK